MADLQAALEFAVELTKFHNIDLFQRGWVVKCHIVVENHSCFFLTIIYHSFSQISSYDSFPQNDWFQNWRVWCIIVVSLHMFMKNKLLKINMWSAQVLAVSLRVHFKGTKAMTRGHGGKRLCCHCEVSGLVTYCDVLAVCKTDHFEVNL